MLARLFGGKSQKPTELALGTKGDFDIRVRKCAKELRARVQPDPKQGWHEETRSSHILKVYLLLDPSLLFCASLHLCFVL